MTAQKILVIGNDKVAAGDLAANLAAFGYEIGIAAPGPGAIDAATRLKPNLLLIDTIGSATGDAATFVGEIRARLPVPVVYISTEPDDNAVRTTSLQGFRVLVKPFTQRELRLHVELVLRDDELTRHVPDLEERFFSVSIDLLCCLDFNGYFRRLNPAWERTLGFTRAELLSKPFFEFVHPDDRERTLNQNREVRGGSRALGFENRYVCKDGSFRWLLWNAAADAQQRVIYAVARDITERKQAEQEREQLVQVLQSAFAEVRMLREILPICSYCRKIRNDENYWMSVEAYIAQNTNTRFSHGICPDCYDKEVAPTYGELGE